MSEASLMRSTGLAGLLCALQPIVCAEPPQAEPEADPEPQVSIEDVRAEAHAKGFADGEAAAAAALLPHRTALEAAAEALIAACSIDPAALRTPLAALVRAIAERVLAAELATGAAVLLPLVEAALAELAPDAAPVLRAHPDTLAALEGHLAGLAVQPDPAMRPESFSLEGPTFLVNASLAARLDEAMATLA